MANREGVCLGRVLLPKFLLDYSNPKMIPDFQTVMLPILEILSDNQSHTLKELVEKISDKYELSSSERIEPLESGGQTIISNRISWAKTHLLKAGLLDSAARGIYTITKLGQEVLAKKPTRIDLRFLRSIPEYHSWRFASKTAKEEVESSVSALEVEEIKQSTPQEVLEDAFKKLREELAIEVLDTVKKMTPNFFENLVVDLLLKMGYGGSRREAGKIIGKSGDGGVDGVIDEDKLGLDKIYVQAKRYQNAVGISEVRDFAGALLAKQTSKGIFIATSAFPQSAYDFVRSINQRIVLIDGKQLAELMIEHNVGVSVKSTFEVKRLDSDYFEEI